MDVRSCMGCGDPAVRHSCATLNPDQSSARSRERAQRPRVFFLTLTYMDDLHGSRLCAEVPAGANSRDTGLEETPNWGASGIVGGSDITFRRHHRLLKSLSLRPASFI